MEQKINEIMHVMNSIEYGFRDENNKNIIYDEEKWRNEFNDFYYLQTPKELLKSKCGICWDQVELERELFKNTKFKYETYFIYLNDNNMLPSHTFLVYQNNNNYYWFEHSWNKYMGVHQYKSMKKRRRANSYFMFHVLCFIFYISCFMFLKEINTVGHIVNKEFHCVLI